MNDINIPDIIDLNNIDLKDLGPPMNLNKLHNSNKYYHMKEFYDDISSIVLKTNILNQIALIQELDDSHDKIISQQMYKILKNMLILNGNTINKMPRFIREIENYLSLLELTDDRIVIHKMIDNIKKGMYKTNIYFRDCDVMISNVPPIPIDERIIIEKTLPQYKYSRQIKKKQKPFEVGEIVGAKDKENKWWLSRILHRYDSPDCSDYWYYIRFENHGPMHDEWISSKTYRVRYFNAKKHFLKRKCTLQE